ncbi:MAG: NAD(P)-binding domain-containing protein, partial [Chloroflexota bacterium]|nr:NAD(P)-binding domain-containing protein [Chloroflexota bacterium]
MTKIGFIGAGTTGTALAVRLSQKGSPVVAVSSRSLSSAQRLSELVSGCRAYPTAQGVVDAADLVFITTPDDAIVKVANEVQWHDGQGVLHCSGAHSVDILETAKQFGASVGSFHPLQTFAGVSQAIENLPGSTFALEAEEPLLSKLKDLASVLNGDWVELGPGDK